MCAVPGGTRSRQRHAFDILAILDEADGGEIPLVEREDERAGELGAVAGLGFGGVAHDQGLSVCDHAFDLIGQHRLAAVNRRHHEFPVKGGRRQAPGLVTHHHRHAEYLVKGLLVRDGHK